VRTPKRRTRKLVIPIALAISAVTTALAAVTTAATVVASAGCGDDEPTPVDAGPPDTPIV
jgi:hypothetical protein